MTIMKTIDATLVLLNTSASIQLVNFCDYTSVPRGHRGVYVIGNGDTAIYVGRGQIRNRLERHMDKALGLGSARDTQGWAWLRNNYDRAVDTWCVYYVEIASEVTQTALEGGLIHLLQPLANSEVRADAEQVL